MTNYDSHGMYIGTNDKEEKVKGIGGVQLRKDCVVCDMLKNDGCDGVEVGQERLCSSIANDSVNHPSHYNDGKVEVIDYIHDKKLGFNLGNAIKYISRAGKKDPNKYVEDLEKAVFYIQDEIERKKEEENE